MTRNARNLMVAAALGVAAGLSPILLQAGDVDQDLVDAHRHLNQTMLDQWMNQHIEQYHDGESPPPGPTGPTGPTGTPPDPPDPPDLPDPPDTAEGCDVLNLNTHQPHRAVTSGDWEGWCMEASDSPRSDGPGGSRGFGDREHLHLEVDGGNTVRSVVELDIPTSWRYGGGAHFGGWVGWDGDQSIRADWNWPDAKGLRQTLYTNDGSGAETDRANMLAAVQVFFPGTFTRCTYTATYTPAAGTFICRMVYEHPQIAGGSVTVDASISGVPTVSAKLGQFAKFGRMHGSDSASRGATAWVRGDSYEARP